MIKLGKDFEELIDEAKKIPVVAEFIEIPEAVTQEEIEKLADELRIRFEL